MTEYKPINWKLNNTLWTIGMITFALLTAFYVNMISAGLAIACSWFSGYTFRAFEQKKEDIK